VRLRDLPGAAAVLIPPGQELDCEGYAKAVNAMIESGRVIRTYDETGENLLFPGPDIEEATIALETHLMEKECWDG